MMRKWLPSHEASTPTAGPSASAWPWPWRSSVRTPARKAEAFLRETATEDRRVTV